MATEFAGRHLASPDVLGRYSDDFCGLTAPVNGRPDWERATLSWLAFMDVCDKLGVPMDKFEIGTSVELLGILLDTDLMLASLTEVKRQRCVAELRDWSQRRQCTRTELQQLVGLLNFICVVVQNGRAFLGRAIALLHATHRERGSILLDKGFRSDISFWYDVMSDPAWSGQALFLEEKWLDSGSLDLFTDAEPTGHGARHGQHWYGVPWSTEDLTLAADACVCDCARHRDRGVSMPFLEMLAFAYAAATWGHLWRGKKITLYSDCQPAIQAFNKRYSSSPELLFVIRLIVILAHRCDFVFRLEWLSTTDNAIADALSRRDFDRFRTLCAAQGISIDSSPTSVSRLPRTPYEN